MNYYVNNQFSTLEYSNYSKPGAPVVMNYQLFSDKKHDELVRCYECNIKYDMHVLKRVSVGKFVCKFCLIKKETV